MHRIAAACAPYGTVASCAGALTDLGLANLDELVTWLEERPPLSRGREAIPCDPRADPVAAQSGIAGRRGDSRASGFGVWSTR